MPQNYEIVDLPGFGFMKGTSRDKTRHIWDLIIQYIETNASFIRVGSDYYFNREFPAERGKVGCGPRTYGS